MRIILFDARRYDRESFTEANRGPGHELTFLETRLTAATAPLAAGHDVVCAFVNDELDADVLTRLCGVGVRLIALRSAGFNHVDLAAAARLRLPVVRVPEYSPHAVAEHAVALVLALIRHLPRAHARVRDGNFSLDGLVGIDLHGKTVGLIGTGKIGRVAARIFAGFGCTVLAHDLVPTPSDVITYVGLDELYLRSDIVSLHVPLTPATRHLIDAVALDRMKRGVILINTGRGALIDTPALIEALKDGRVRGAGLDVYEEEEGVFFEDLSGQVLQDDVLARLISFPNVLVTAHQAFLTREALAAIAETTLASVTAFERHEPLLHQITEP
ncbi:MAG TPA: 2-hydroxyacid dehydrogenase [Kofleriaceae bacterium]|jgi:D-lactate dehydrogenase|nr:2-hydroxyacid dehydrogenase [Kofleriaceae bacterium]